MLYVHHTLWPQEEPERTHERKKEEEAYSEIKDGMDENETDDEDGRKLRTAFS